MSQTPNQQAAIVTGLIRNGKLDPYLLEIDQAIGHRRQTLNMKKSIDMGMKLKAGDIVVIGAVRPKLLQGRRAVVRGRKNGKIVINLMGDANMKWKANRDIYISPGSLEIVTETEA